MGTAGAAMFFANVLVSLVALFGGSVVGLLISVNYGTLRAILAACAGAVGSLLGTWLAVYLWGTYYAEPIIHEIGHEAGRTPGGWLPSMLMGGLLGAGVFSLIVVWVRRK